MLLLINSQGVSRQLTMWKSQALQHLFQGVEMASVSKQRPTCPQCNIWDTLAPSLILHASNLQELNTRLVKVFKEIRIKLTKII